jgi:hypothetical protein
VTLKSEVTSADGAAFVEAARRFFNLSDAGTDSNTEDIEVEGSAPRTSINKPG